jgi:hypothetical protein
MLFKDRKMIQRQKNDAYSIKSLGSIWFSVE